MGIDINKFRAYLENTKVEQRYKLAKDGEVYSTEDAFLMLNEIYRSKVEARKRVFDMSKSESAIKKAAKWITTSERPGLLLYGTIGSGKSTLADSLANLIGIVNPNEKIVRKSAIEIADIARDSKDSFEDIMKAKMLFIDDLGEESLMVKNYGNEFSPLVNLFYHRYDKMLLTIVTTNKIESEISNIYGPRVWDRMEEDYDMAYFSLESFRKQK